MRQQHEQTARVIDRILQQRLSLNTDNPAVNPFRITEPDSGCFHQRFTGFNQ